MCTFGLPGVREEDGNVPPVGVFVAVLPPPPPPVPPLFVDEPGSVGVGVPGATMSTLPPPFEPATTEFGTAAFSKVVWPAQLKLTEPLLLKVTCFEADFEIVAEPPGRPDTTRLVTSLK